MTNIAISSLVLPLVALAACVPTSGQNPTPVPTEFIHVHSYFAAYAFLDTNGNGQLDSADTPIKDATFIAALQGGTEFGDETDETGYAFISIPASVEFPITLRMDAPKDSTLKAIEPTTITLSEVTGETVQFLFSSGETK
ncbi:MAG TPA: hypothetical protein VK900_20185 [Anaerolineales bacterium]|nr:hypothetical protein [Anaerolineales bacterium]